MFLKWCSAIYFLPESSYYYLALSVIYYEEVYTRKTLVVSSHDF